MNDTDVSQYITKTFKGVDFVVNSDNRFFFYNPDPDVEPDHMFPWLTIMVNDVNDKFSNLDRPDAFRINIGVSKQMFRSLFGEIDGKDIETSYDFTVFDQLMPHPVYGRMYWLCILNPSDDTFDKKVLPLMNEAYDSAVTKYNKKSASQ